MNITQRPAARLRAAAVAAAAIAASSAGLLAVGGAAQASTSVRPNGYVVIDNCTGLAGSISYSPGMRKAILKNVQAVMTGTTSGCSDIFNGPESGTGTFTAVLHGKADVNAENFTGTFTINWPAGTGYNPSNGTLNVSESNGLENVSGTVTSGFDTGTVLAAQYVVTSSKGTGTKAHPVTKQAYTNTQPLTLSRNEG